MAPALADIRRRGNNPKEKNVSPFQLKQMLSQLYGLEPGDRRSSTSFGIGAVAGTGSTVKEYGSGAIHQTVITLSALPISVSRTHTGGGTKIYDFPEGRILSLGGTGTVTFTTTSAILTTLNGAKTITMGVGTVQTTTQDSGTSGLLTTEQGILQVANATSSSVINTPGTAGTFIGALAAFDGTTTPVDAYLNVNVPTASDIDGDATLTASGTITISWMNLGDY